MEAVKSEKNTAPTVALIHFISAAQLAPSSFNRYCSRLRDGVDIVQKRGRKTVELDVHEYVRELLGELGKKKKKRRRRFARPKNGNSRFEKLSQWEQRRLSKEVTRQYNAAAQLETSTLAWCEPHLVWSMDISEYNFNGIIFNVLQVMDLGSRIKFEPLLKYKDFTAVEVAEHLEFLMKKYGPPLFLKRDNGGNLGGDPIGEILKFFAVIPYNSPPGYPQYNGNIEKAQGDLKRRTVTMFGADPPLTAAKGMLMYAINEHNSSPMPALGGAAPLELWARPSRKFSKFERKQIAKIIARQAIRSINGSGNPMTAEVFTGVWRYSARRIMEKLGILKISVHKQMPTDSETTASKASILK